jgi:hypothetical protein
MRRSSRQIGERPNAMLRRLLSMQMSRKPPVSQVKQYQTGPTRPELKSLKLHAPNNLKQRLRGPRIHRASAQWITEPRPSDRASFGAISPVPTEAT